MRGLFAIFGYFYHSMPALVKIVANLAALIFLSTIFIPDPAVQSSLRMLALIMGIGLSYSMIIFNSYWHLVTNRRLSSLPNFQLSTGIAILSITLLSSVAISFIHKSDNEFFELSRFLTWFIITSAVFGYTALLKKNPKHLITGIFLLLLSLAPIYNESIQTLITDLPLIQFAKRIFLLSTFMGWLYALYTLHTKKIRAGTPLNQFQQFYFSQARKRVEKIELKKKTNPNIEKLIKLLALQPIYKGERIERENEENFTFKGIVLQKTLINITVPLVTASVLFVVNLSLYQLGNTSNLFGKLTLIEIFLICSLYTPTFLLPHYANQVGQFRKLWLRASGDRYYFWNTIEQDMIRDIKPALLTATFNTFLAIIYTDWSLLNCTIYFSMMFIVTLYIIYFGVIGGCKGWKDISISLAGQMPIILCITLFASPAHDIPQITISLVVTLIIAIYALRSAAKKCFLNVDWFRLLPSIQSKTLRYHILKNHTKVTMS